jgi:hypothetical protein
MLSKFKMFKLMSIFCVIGALSWALAGFSQVPQATVQLTTDPPKSQILPFEAEATNYLGSGQYRSPVRLKLQALGAKGEPLNDARVHLKILTPSPTPWFTTDFPIVEGTPLLDIVGNAPTGAFQVQQTFPIRGDYQLQVEVEPAIAGAFEPFKQTLKLGVSENPLKSFYFFISLGALLAIGAVGGWVIGSRQQIQPGEIAPQRVRLLLSGITVLAIGALLFFNISAESHYEHRMEEASSGSGSNPQGMMESQGLRLEITGDKSARVGQLASLQAKLVDRQTRQPVTNAVFSIRAVQLENNWVAFAHQGRADRQGIFGWQEQFFDGAPHRVEIEVSPSLESKNQFQPFQAVQNIDVEGVEPPISVRIIGLVYFTGVVALGTFLGLWFQRRRRQGLTAKAI